MEIRLDPDIQQSEPPSTPLSVEAAELLRVLHAAPMTKRQETILRTIASKYYREGQCYARQSRIADAVGCAKSTLQLDLDELEARGLIRVHRRIGTSNVTILADGMIEALKAMRIDRRRTRLERDGIEIANASFRTLPTPTIVLPAHVVPPVLQTSNRPKDAERPRQHSTSLPKSFISNTPSPRAQERESTRDDVSKNNDETAQVLIQEGITPKRARLFARIFDADRIKANVTLGLHRAKKNPGGYLAYMLQHDIAAAHVAPGSEAERVRAAECAPRSLPPREREPIATPVPSKAVLQEPSAHDDAAARFAELTPNERAEYEALAERELRHRLSGLGNFFDLRRPTIQAMLTAHAVQAFRLRGINVEKSLDGRVTAT